MQAIGLMIRLLSKPVTLQANESMNIIVQIQPLQIGYHEIVLRVQNETNLLDRIDIKIEVPAVSPWELSDTKKGETSKVIQSRVIAARQIQIARLHHLGITEFCTNSCLKGKLLEEICQMDNDAQNLLISFADKNSLSARAYHRTLRLARTIADLQNESKILKLHIAEALSYRRNLPGKK